MGVGAKEPRGARAHAQTAPRAHTRAHQGAQELTPSAPRMPEAAPHPGDGTRRLERGPGGSYRGHESRCCVPRAPRVLVWGQQGRAARRRLRGDRARRLRRHFIPGPARRRGQPGWVGTRGTGGRRGEAAPGAHVCPARGEELGCSPRSWPRAPPRRAWRRPRPRVAAQGLSRGP